MPRRCSMPLAAFALFTLLAAPLWAQKTAVAKPESVGVDAAALGKIAPRMQQFVEDRQSSGVVTLVAKDGKIVSLEAVGQADIEAGREMTTDTMFAIASMTKPITATALMTLVDEKKVSLDDPVSKYIPEFKNIKVGDAAPNREVTIRDVITHTSGLGGDQRVVGSLKEHMQELVKRGLNFQPGTKWQYSPGLNVCGRVIEVVSGKPYAEYVEQRILKPLGMRNSTFFPTAQQQPRLARLYQPGPDKKSLAPAEHWLTDMSAERVANPSGGLFSTAADLSRFYQMILNGGELDGKRIVSADAVTQMTSLQTGELKTGFTPGNGWGLGWCLVREPQGVTKDLSPGTFGHGGAFGTQGWVDPQRKMIFVLMIQRTKFGNSDGSDLRGAFHELAVGAVK